MLMEILKQRIVSLDAEAYAKTMNCVEALKAAIDAAGPAGILALEYTRIARQEQLILALRTSNAALKASMTDRESLSRSVLALEDALRTANAKIATLSKKKKKTK